MGLPIENGQNFNGISEEVVMGWSNQWDSVWRDGIPQDFQHPYGRFDFILHEVDKLGCQKVLDVAMGPGRHAVVLARKGLDVWGFDLSVAGLELARSEFQKENLKCQMQMADMFKIFPYASSSFDAVVAIQAIYHGLPQHMKFAVNEIHRVLNPGGLFGFTVSMDCERPMVEMTENGELARKARLEDKLYKLVKGAPNTYIFETGREKGIPHYYPNEIELIRMLERKFNHINVFTDYENKYRLVTCTKA